MNGKTFSPVVLRRRSGWEASEMGMLLWQLNYRPLFLFFGIPLGIAAIAIRFLPQSFMQIGGIALWWLMPLWDRFALHVISVRFFEPRAPLRRLFSGLGKTLRQGLAGDLLWRRFSPFRSARMPIAVLEKIRGPALRLRKQLLGKNGLDFGFPLTLICLGLETVLGLGELAFIYGLRQNFFLWFLIDPWAFLEEAAGILLMVTWINQILIESLYVCMGFGLYINSRVETEGWDIELLFKESAEKRKKHSAVLRKSAVLCLALFFCAASPAAGEDVSGENGESAEADFSFFDPDAPEIFVPETTGGTEAALLETVLASPDFGAYREGWRLQLKRGKDRDRRAVTFTRRDTEGSLRELFGILLRAAVCAVIGAALAFTVYHAYRKGFFSRLRVRFRGGKTELRKKQKTEPPGPAPLLEAALAAREEGRVREAWALCLRAFLACFALAGVRFPAGATEYEALSLVRCAGGASADRNCADGNCESREKRFAVFLRRWISFAYGGQEPEPRDFDDSVRDCRELME